MPGLKVEIRKKNQRLIRTAHHSFPNPRSRAEISVLVSGDTDGEKYIAANGNLISGRGRHLEEDHSGNTVFIF